VPPTRRDVTPGALHAQVSIPSSSNEEFHPGDEQPYQTVANNPEETIFSSFTGEDDYPQDNHSDPTLSSSNVTSEEEEESEETEEKQSQEEQQRHEKQQRKEEQQRQEEQQNILKAIINTITTENSNTERPDLQHSHKS
jgi:hypothetical protein